MATSRDVAQHVSWRQWYLVGEFGLVNALSQADRAGLNLIVNPLKMDLQISDTQVSLLIGLSFIMLYSVLSVPAGYLVDLLNRRALLGAAIVFWSAMEVVCGYARNYWQLFAGRTGLGIGEAVVAPAAYSLMRDSVAANSRVRAFAIYNVTGVLGTNLGTLAGGLLFGSAVAGALHGVPLLGGLKPWQVVLVVPGLAGLLVALLLTTIPEPARAAPASRDAVGFGEAYRYIVAHGALYAPVFGAFLLACLASTGWHAWMAAAIGRTWQLSPAVIGRTSGSIGVLLSPVPTLLLAYQDGLLQGARPPGGAVLDCRGLLCDHVAAAELILLAPTLHAMWIAYGVWTVFSYTAVGNVCAMTLVEITPSHLVGKVTSLYFLFAYALGVASGPTIFALVAQLGSGGPAAISNSMSICYPAALLMTVTLLLISARQVRGRTAEALAA